MTCRAILVAGLLLCAMSVGCKNHSSGGAGSNASAPTPTTAPSPPPVPTPPLCHTASEPPQNPPDSATLFYGCHDFREFGATPPALTEFVAFHTRLPDPDLAVDPRGQAMHPISGEYTDVVVNLPGLGRLEFPRRTSYLPVWIALSGNQTAVPELVTRTGDGIGQRPDRLNRYSYARVVHADSARIDVHWRYVADHCNPTPTGVVHEIFSVFPNGTMKRVVHRSADTLEDAATPANNFSQNLTLGASGLTFSPASNVPRPIAIPGGSGPAITAHPVAGPRLDLRLDDGSTPGARTAMESVSGANGSVAGRFASWSPGVSGSALSFDGYTTEVSYPASSAPAPAGSFTLEAWIALEAYPFGTVQVAGQATPGNFTAYSPDTVEGGIGTYNSVDPTTGLPITNPVTVGGFGYLLAIDALGRPSIMGNFGGTWNGAVGTRLARNEWHHITGVYDATANALRIFVNGSPVASANVTGALVPAPTRDFVVGRNREPQWIVAGSEMHVDAFRNAIFGIEGQLDEVRLYDRALTAAEIAQAAVRPGASSAATLPVRQLPQFSGSQFEAEQSTIQYHPSWNQLFHDSGRDDVVITYHTLPTSLVFWKGMSYGPAWVSENGIWTHDQSMEWGDSNGLAEHMSDKQLRYAHVRVIEDTPARKVVHWRYAPVGVTYRLLAPTGELSWVDEYYTIYPDGTTVRFVDDWWCSVEGGTPTGFQGTYVLTGPNQIWSDVINNVAASVVAADGTRGDLDVVAATPPANLLSNAVVIMTNTKSVHRLYRGLTTGSPLTYYANVLDTWDPEPVVAGDAQSSSAPFSYGNHFPVAQIPNDGRTALFNDRIGHSEGIVDVPPEPARTKVMLYGFSQTPEAALPTVNGWNDAPAVKTGSTSISGGFDRRQNAYVFFLGSSLNVSFIGSTPVRNPCFVVRDWSGSATPTVTVDGNPVAARVGIHFNGGSRTLVVWLPVTTTSTTTISVQ